MADAGRTTRPPPRSPLLLLLLAAALTCSLVVAQMEDEQAENDRIAFVPISHDRRLDDLPSPMGLPDNPNPERMGPIPQRGLPDSAVDHAIRHISQNMVRMHRPGDTPPGDANPADMAVNGGRNTHIRLHNNNQIKTNHDILADWDKIHERRMKTNAEAAGKHLQEADMKTAREEQVKLRGVFHQKIIMEEESKNFEQVLRVKSEVSRKKNRESFVKSQEEAEKASVEAQGKTRLVLSQQHRYERVTKAKKMAAQRKLEIDVEVRSKRNWELSAKHRAEREVKNDSKRRKHKSKLEKQEADERYKKEIENEKFDRKQEQLEHRSAEQKEAWMKAHDKQYEHAYKSDEKVRLKADKARRKNGKGQWCECRTVDVDLKKKNAWASCPSGMLMVAIIRSKKNDLRGIERLECCEPCRPNGEDLEVVQCENADWTKTFNEEGWSTCPAYSYIQGIFKSACNKIYCIEYARCCKIAGSRGRTDCAPKKSWVESMDKAGWSELDKNYFMAGLYRSKGHALSNIEAPMQCRYYAYN